MGQTAKIAVFTTSSMPGLIALQDFVNKNPEKISAFLLFPNIPQTLQNKKRRFFKILLQLSFSQIIYKFLETHLFHFFRWILGRPTPKRLALRNGIPFSKFNNPNEAQLIDYLKALKVTLIINNQPALLKESILSIPSDGCINFHGGLLPQYRGVANHFWVLINNESQAGATVHLMTAGRDEGDVLAKKTLTIHPEDSVHLLNYKINALGPCLFSEVVQNIETGKLNPQKQTSSEATYRSFPTRKDMARLRKNGRSIFTLPHFLTTLKH